MTLEPSAVYLGTVAIEPSRWAAFLGDGDDLPLVAVSEWLDQIHASGFDGLEIWERHLTDAAPAEVDAVLGHELPTTILSSYVSFDDPDDRARRAAAAWATRAGAAGVKFNVGNDGGAELLYAERIAAWIDQLPSDTTLLCECHHGVSIAEHPDVAARIFRAAGPADRVQAIVHTHEEPDAIRARFDAYGERIRHVHVNFLDFDAMAAPRLRDVRDRAAQQIELLTSLGFAGSWTIEFTHGLLTDDDRPACLVAQAAEDLRVLRELLP